MATRRLGFNIPELGNAAARALNRPAADVDTIQKIAEGGCSRILEVTMSDGCSILARLLYPLTIPRRLAVASKVARVDFLRVHGILAHRVLAFLTGADAVGAEYMLIEPMPGKQLSSFLYSLSDKERYKVLH
jgi:hypothetical protein